MLSWQHICRSPGENSFNDQDASSVQFATNEAQTWPSKALHKIHKWIIFSGLKSTKLILLSHKY